jgi:hypothetical protein
MVITEEPEQINEVNEGKTVVLDNMLIKQKKTDVMRMFKNGIKREPERKLPETTEPERKLPETTEPERTTYNKSKNIISLDV